MVFHPVPLFHSSTHYEELSRRVHRQINSSAAQATRRTIIVRQSGERIGDWYKLIEHLDAEESVRVRLMGDSTAHLSWTNQHRS
ncbi:DUF1654 domain-containing protein [Pseudomonas helleri]|uniref:DUF1654 domain-containing protein n=1 Tax=Pseudomonas helleri TaxID=1608996 RepID=UPI001297F3C8|nr:DUF1654 domain-containing protein [Pseudomonas helleri]